MAGLSTGITIMSQLDLDDKRIFIAQMSPVALLGGAPIPQRDRFGRLPAGSKPIHKASSWRYLRRPTVPTPAARYTSPSTPRLHAIPTAVTTANHAMS